MIVVGFDFLIAGRDIFEAGSREIAIADVEREALGEVEAQAGQELVGDGRIFVVDVRFAAGAAVMNARADARIAEAEADIRLDRAALVEIVDQVQHAGPGLGLIAEIGGGAVFQLVETIGEFTFEAEAVVEGEAERARAQPIILHSQRAAEARRVGRVQIIGIDRAIEAVPSGRLAIPAVRRVRDTSRPCHDGGERDRFGHLQTHGLPSLPISPRNPGFASQGDATSNHPEVACVLAQRSCGGG
jgi:hypothetical protein